MFWTKRKILDYTPSLRPNELKKRVKILVVDDNEEHFPYKNLQDNGYTIEWWKEVTSEKLQRMENGDFDIIILDIKGIADTTVSETDGLGIIKRIKSVNPSQIVIAFSGHSYDLDKTEFWKIADDTLSKPVSIVKAKELLDRIIKEKITIQKYWAAILHILSHQGISKQKLQKLEKIILNMLETKKTDVDSNCKKILSGIQNTAAIVTLIQALLRLWI